MSGLQEAALGSTSLFIRPKSPYPRAGGGENLSQSLPTHVLTVKPRLVAQLGVSSLLNKAPCFDYKDLIGTVNRS